MRVFAVMVFALALAAPALAADGEPKKALTAKGEAIAKSIVLKRSDLSAGFVAHEPSDDPRPKGARCGAVDESDLTVIGDADSPDFSRDAAGVAVGSSASVYRSQRESNAAWRRAATGAALRCFSDLVRLTAPAARKVKIVSAKRIPFPQGSSRTIAYRVVATMSIGGSRTIRAIMQPKSSDPCYVANRKCITSPSATTYSLPSSRSLPMSRAPASPPPLT